MTRQAAVHAFATVQGKPSGTEQHPLTFQIQNYKNTVIFKYPARRFEGTLAILSFSMIIALRPPCGRSFYGFQASLAFWGKIPFWIVEIFRCLKFMKCAGWQSLPSPTCFGVAGLQLMEGEGYRLQFGDLSS